MDLIYRNPVLSVLFPILSCGSLLYLRYDINSKQNCKSSIQAQLSDYLLRNKIWSRTAVRRVFNSIGLILPAIALSFITTLKCDTDAVIAMICLCCGFSGFIFSGYNTPNHADLAPAYAGTLFGITNMIGKLLELNLRCSLVTFEMNWDKTFYFQNTWLYKCSPFTFISLRTRFFIPFRRIEQALFFLVG